MWGSGGKKEIIFFIIISHSFWCCNCKHWCKFTQSCINTIPTFFYDFDQSCEFYQSFQPPCRTGIHRQTCMSSAELSVLCTKVGLNFLCFLKHHCKSSTKSDCKKYTHRMTGTQQRIQAGRIMKTEASKSDASAEQIKVSWTELVLFMS